MVDGEGPRSRLRFRITPEDDRDRPAALFRLQDPTRDLVPFSKEAFQRRGAAVAVDQTAELSVVFRWIAEDLGSLPQLGLFLRRWRVRGARLRELALEPDAKRGRVEIADLVQRKRCRECLTRSAIARPSARFLPRPPPNHSGRHDNPEP